MRCLVLIGVCAFGGCGGASAPELPDAGRAGLEVEGGAAEGAPAAKPAPTCTPGCRNQFDINVSCPDFDLKWCGVFSGFANGPACGQTDDFITCAWGNGACVESSRTPRAQACK